MVCLPGPGVCLPGLGGGVSAWSGGVCLVRGVGGVWCLPGRGGLPGLGEWVYPSMH